MKQIDLSIVNEEFLNNYISTINVTDIKGRLEESGINQIENVIDNLKSILIATPSTLKSEYLDLVEHLTKEEKIEVKKIFDYSSYRKKKEFIEFFRKLEIKSCPFCNNNYVYFFEENAGKINTIATLEHYYPKAQYPHLSLSFYNLIPSCYICNTKFKGKEEHVGSIIHPYIEDFSEKAKFTISMESLPNDINIDLDTNDERAEKSIDRFQLKQIYQKHDDIAIEIWNKAQIYNESRIDELYESFYKSLGYSKQDVKDMIFCNYLKNNDINKRNHSKLTQDILKQYGFIQ